MRNNNEPIVRQLQHNGELKPLASNGGPDLPPDAINYLFVEPTPNLLERLSVSVLASQLANLLLDGNYQPSFNDLRATVARLRAELGVRAPGAVERCICMKSCEFSYTAIGRIKGDYLAVVMRSVYERNIIADAGIILKEVHLQGVCEITADIIKNLAPEEVHSPDEAIFLRIEPQSQIAFDSDVISEKFLSLSSDFPADQWKHENYAHSGSCPGTDGPCKNLVSTDTGISILGNPWMEVSTVPEPAEGSLSDHFIKLSGSESNGKVFSVGFRATQWPGQYPTEPPAMLIENTGAHPIFLALWPRKW